MSLSDLGKVCLFSKMSGVITSNGVPVARAKVVRTADRNGAVTDETVTDESGRFGFPAIFERTVTKYFPQEFVASQKIIVFYGGKEHEIWWGFKRKPEENIESRGNPLIVTCDLNNEEKAVLIDQSTFHGLCSWDVVSDVPVNWEEQGVLDSDIEQNTKVQ